MAARILEQEPVSKALSREATATVRGYIYQFDATIRKLLVLPPTSSLTVEGVEDFDESSDDGFEHSQVKYYAAQKLTDAVLRDALLPMLKDYLSRDVLSRSEKAYVLYGYFKESDLLCITLDLAAMQRLLTKGHYQDLAGKRTKVTTNLQAELNASDRDLIDFAQRVRVSISKEYQEHKALVINELKDALRVSKTEAETYSYPTALTFVSELAANPAALQRVTTRELFITAVRPSAALYNAWTLREAGNLAFCQMMRSRYLSSLNVDCIERFFVISGVTHSPMQDVAELVRHIAAKWSSYKSGRKPDNERYTPYVLFPDLSDSQLVEVKQMLVDDGILFADGYLFPGARWDLSVVKEPQTSHRRIAIRFLGNMEQFNAVISTLRRQRLIVQLYLTQREHIPHSYRHICIPVMTTDMMKAII